MPVQLVAGWGCHPRQLQKRRGVISMLRAPKPMAFDEKKSSRRRMDMQEGAVLGEGNSRDVGDLAWLDAGAADPVGEVHIRFEWLCKQQQASSAKGLGGRARKRAQRERERERENVPHFPGVSRCSPW